jgi:uncharacterized protein YdeI (BOF family)
MYKHCLILLLSSLVASTALAEDPAGQEQQQETEQTTRQAGTKQQPQAKPAAPASTFTPSEEVSADSAVSFPVDI